MLDPIYADILRVAHFAMSLYWFFVGEGAVADLEESQLELAEFYG